MIRKWGDLPEKEQKEAVEWWEIKEIIDWEYESWRQDPEFHNKLENE